MVSMKTFADGFLGSVARHGRVFEAGLAAVFALKSGKPLQDAGLGPAMLSRGKLAFLPHEPEGQGKAEVAAGWKRFFDGPQAPFSWEPDLVEVLGDGTLALSTGPVRNPVPSAWIPAYT